MSSLVAVLNQKTLGGGSLRDRLRWRPLALVLLAALALTSAETLRIVMDSLSEAYLAVTVFVAGTLALVYGLERAFKGDIGTLLERFGRWQVPAGAVMGAFPGCGGAIVMVTQFTKGHASFGTLVATLTATMGDAMFLLLAKEPGTALGIIVLSVVVGSLSGLAVDALHGRGFLQPRRPAQAAKAPETAPGADAVAPAPLRLLWFVLLVPGLALGVMGAFQVELGSLVTLPAGVEPELWLGVAGAVLALILWAGRSGAQVTPADSSCRREDVGSRIMADTNFITAWVVFAFLVYELGLHFSGVDLAAAFALWAPLVPLAAILVGFLPGCGPPIVVTTLYLTGSLPLSAQIGNAISNDGDALFPALALAPKAAMVATLYSALPALLVAYGCFLIWE